MVDAVSRFSTPFEFAYVVATSIEDVERVQAERRTGESVDIVTARLALDKALETGKFILDVLEKLRGSLLHANMDGVVANSEFARYSRQGEVAVLLGDIDRAVGLSEYGGINFVSSESSAVRLQTSDEGGSMNVSPMPMDTTALAIEDLAIMPMDLLSLGISDFGIISDYDLEKSTQRLSRAIETANLRFAELNELSEIISGGQSFLSMINDVSFSVDARSLPLGIFVDVLA